MIIETRKWLREKAERWIRIVDNNPNYKLWDFPLEVTSGLSESTIYKILKEVALIDIEQAWGRKEREKLEANNPEVIIL